MSELQLGLLAIGAVVIVGVFAYNRLQERRARAAAQRAFPPPSPDALMGEGAPRPEAAPSARAAGAREAPAAAPDARIDYVIELRPRARPSAAAIEEQWRPIARRHAPRASLAGPDGEGVLRAGLQLVSRAGTVGEAELIEFRAAVETMASALGAAVSAPEMKVAMERARALDALCADADIQVVLHVVAAPGGALAGSAIAAAAAAAGLALAPDGRFVQRAGDERVVLALAARDGAPFDAARLPKSAYSAVSLALEVPHAADPRGAFEAMVRLARELAGACGGELVDDRGRALGDAALAAIAARLDQVRDALAAHGVAPGGALAARLFA
ncbi:MAG: cell division protein ZipA C-terminal FtsZ-binding domain-containing protein [Burkholderiales bacterium]|nr:cell division protein ZipA C-terminal FtsZ-binding domain-containing protein [Burkholderiales bacterium]